MEQNDTPSPAAGLGYVILAISMKIFVWIGANSVDAALSRTATIVSICAGIMAVRHYYLAHKKKNI